MKRKTKTAVTQELLSKVKNLREDYKLTVVQTAKVLGIGQGTVWKAETTGYSLEKYKDKFRASAKPKREVVPSQPKEKPSAKWVYGADANTREILRVLHRMDHSLEAIINLMHYMKSAELPKKKKAKSPTMQAYAEFTSQVMKEGHTLKEAAALWKERKETLRRINSSTDTAGTPYPVGPEINGTLPTY